MEIQLKSYQVLGLSVLLQAKVKACNELDQALRDLGLDPHKDYEITEQLTIREVQRAANNLPHE